MPSKASLTFATVLLVLTLATASSAAQPGPRTLEEFDRYVAATESRLRRQESSAQTFLSLDSLSGADRAAAEMRLRKGEILIHSLGENPLKIHGGLVHHWVGTAFLPRTTLQSTLAVIQDYDHLTRYYSPEVMRSQLISRRGDDFQIAMRLRKHKVVTVVLDTEYDVRYGALDATHRYSHSHSTRVTEIDHPGEKDEHAAPAGDDHGFMWSLDTYWRFVQVPDGVIVECEAISLTRDIPTGLGWMIEPFIKNIPRESLEFTLRSTRDALPASGAAPAFRANLQ